MVKAIIAPILGPAKMDSAECWYPTEQDLFTELNQYHAGAKWIISETGMVLPFTADNVIFLCQSVESFQIGQHSSRPKAGTTELEVVMATVDMLPPTRQTTIYMNDPDYVASEEAELLNNQYQQAQ